MATQFPDLFAALAAPFDAGEVKTLNAKGVGLSYITARTAMNRLDDVLGPENWWDRYRPHGNGVCCELSVKLPDGSVITKEGIGGITKMRDESDTDKTGESDSLKRAAAKFGVARYLYRDGVPEFVREPEPDDAPAGAPRQAAPSDPPRDRGGDRQGDRPHGPPRSGKALFAWARELEKEKGVTRLVDALNQYGRKHNFPDRIVEWNADQAVRAYDTARPWVAWKQGITDREPGQDG